MQILAEVQRSGPSMAMTSYYLHVDIIFGVDWASHNFERTAPSTKKKVILNFCFLSFFPRDGMHNNVKYIYLNSV